MEPSDRPPPPGLYPGTSVLVFVAAAVAALLLHHLAANAPGPAAAERGGEGEVDVLLTVEAHQEGRDIADLLADADVALAYQHARVVDRLREPELEDLGLQAALHDLRAGETQHVIQLLLALHQQADADHATEQRFALEHVLLALLVEREQVTCRGADLGQGVLHAPHLALVLQAILAHDLHLRVQALLLEGALRLTERLAIILIALLSAHCSRKEWVGARIVREASLFL